MGRQNGVGGRLGLVRFRPLLVVLAIAVAGCGTDDGSSGIDGTPQAGDSFQWQLTGYPPDLSVDAETYDLDLFDVPDAAIEELHDRGVTVACYFSAGTYEDFREDAEGFPEDTRGEPLPDFSDERWLDVRRIDDLAPVIEARLDRCAERGFDAVELDNVDAYANESGFPLTADDQLAFNRWLADESRERGLAPGLKGTVELAPQLVDDFDWALVEQCIQYEECDGFQPFVDAGKAVFVVEYEGTREEVCGAAADLEGMTVVLADLDLDGPVDPC
jgi:hypothetical protein